jgi:CBS domain-containing protein
MANLIHDRVLTFLKETPPFYFLHPEELQLLTESLNVRYIEEEEILFEEGTPARPEVYLIRDGSVWLLQQDKILDRLEPGELVGVRSLLTSRPYKATARVAEASLLYEIPVAVFKPMVENHSAVAAYFAKNLASGPSLSVEERAAMESPLHLSFAGFSVQGTAPVICAQEEESLQSAAQRMMKHGVSALIITDEASKPKGILTDVDIRSWVANPLPMPKVQAYMSSPVLCVREGADSHQILQIMMQKKIKHLAVTEDGTAATALKAIITRQDVLLAQGWNPFRSMEDIRKSTSAAELPALRDKAEKLAFEWLESELPLGLINTFITSINDALISKAVDLAFRDAGVDQADYRFCWLSLGSEGRKEQLLRTDQDNALIFDAEHSPEGAQEKLLQVAAKVNDTLASCGFVYCPADMMARNPDWCLSMDQWKKKFSRWIEEPEPQAVRYSTIFFDFRAVAGDEALGEELKAHILAVLKKEQRFFSFLAKDAVDAPLPLGFFKGFVLEKTGDGEESFDLKARALMPLTDAARLLALDYGYMESPGTLDRFRFAATQDSRHTHLLEDAARAYEVLLQMRAKYGYKHADQGRYVPIAQMSKLEKQMLRAALRPARELQQMLRVRFSTQLFG